MNVVGHSTFTQLRKGGIKIHVVSKMPPPLLQPKLYDIPIVESNFPAISRTVRDLEC